MLTYVPAGDVPSKGPTVGILNWKQYVLDTFPGGLDLGAFGIRDIRGGTTLSVHAVGRAWDWRYENPGPGRETADAAIAFTIANFEVLGIQAIHDYVQCRIWRCDRPSIGPGWKRQKPGNGMGAAWAGWLHFEVHPNSALHTATVHEVLAGAGTPVAVAPPSQTGELPQWPLGPNDSGAPVTLLQQVLAFWGYYKAEVHDCYDDVTAQAVAAWQENLQPFNVGHADGNYGPRTHAGAAASYAALAELAAARRAA